MNWNADKAGGGGPPLSTPEWSVGVRKGPQSRKAVRPPFQTAPASSSQDGSPAQFRRGAAGLVGSSCRPGVAVFQDGSAAQFRRGAAGLMGSSGCSGSVSPFSPQTLTASGGGFGITTGGDDNTAPPGTWPGRGHTRWRKSAIIHDILRSRFAQLIELEIVSDNR
jgi:hypothetical protein